MPHIKNDYEKQEEAIKQRLDKATKSSDSEILGKRAEKEKRDTPKINQNIQMARMLLDEGLEMYKAGEMNFKEFADDLHKSLLAVSGK